MTAPLRAIETVYKGYRFRSRLEARWAVFFDAAKIDWQYEVDGYWIDGRPYLPDFWLPNLEVFVEIKPTKEAAGEAITLMKGLVIQSKKRGLVIIGPPNDHKMWDVVNYCDNVGFMGADWHQCIFCNEINFRRCDCAPSITVLRDEPNRSSLIDHALGEAQRARFEHGENGQPRPHRSSQVQVDVYWAGAVIEEVDDGDECIKLDGTRTAMTRTDVCAWRREIARPSGKPIKPEEFEKHRLADGRFRYAGPTIIACHGQAEEGLAIDCVCEVRDADVVFAWIDRCDTVGTLVEIGAAHAFGRPIFIAFASDALATHFYFAAQLATVAVIAPNALAAYRYFKNWQNR